MSRVVEVELEKPKIFSWFLSGVVLLWLGQTVYRWWLSPAPLHHLAMVSAIVCVISGSFALGILGRKSLQFLRYTAETQVLSFVEVSGDREHVSDFPLRGTPYRVEIDEDTDPFREVLATVGLLKQTPSTRAIIRLRNQRYTLELPRCLSDVDARVLANVVNERPAGDEPLSNGDFEVERSEDETTIRWTIEVDARSFVAAGLMVVCLVSLAFWLLPYFEDYPIVFVLLIIPLLFVLSLLSRAPLRRAQKKFVTLRATTDGLQLITDTLEIVAEKPEIEVVMFRGDPTIIVGKPKDDRGRSTRTGLAVLKPGATLLLAELLYRERERLRRWQSESGAELADEDA